jgi:hypothetical protein
MVHLIGRNDIISELSSLLIPKSASGNKPKLAVFISQSAR